ALPSVVHTRLEWLVDALVQRAQRNTNPDERPQLVLDLRAAQDTVDRWAADIAQAVNAAVRAALPRGAALTPEQFIQRHIELGHTTEPGERVSLRADVLGPLHDLDPEPPDISVAADQHAAGSSEQSAEEPSAAATASAARDVEIISLSSQDSSSDSDVVTAPVADVVESGALPEGRQSPALGTGSIRPQADVTDDGVLPDAPETAQPQNGDSSDESSSESDQNAHGDDDDSLFGPADPIIPWNATAPDEPLSPFAEQVLADLIGGPGQASITIDNPEDPQPPAHEPELDLAAANALMDELVDFNDDQNLVPSEQHSPTAGWFDWNDPLSLDEIDFSTPAVLSPFNQQRTPAAEDRMDIDTPRPASPAPGSPAFDGSGEQPDMDRAEATEPSAVDGGVTSRTGLSPLRQTVTSAAIPADEVPGRERPDDWDSLYDATPEPEIRQATPQPTTSVAEPDPALAQRREEAAIQREHSRQQSRWQAELEVAEESVLRRSNHDTRQQIDAQQPAQTETAHEPPYPGAEPKQEWAGPYGQGGTLHPDSIDDLRERAHVVAVEQLARASGGRENLDIRLTLYHHFAASRPTEMAAAFAKGFLDLVDAELEALQGGGPQHTVASMNLRITQSTRSGQHHSRVELWTHPGPGLRPEDYRTMTEAQFDFTYLSATLP
ncbi:hypothetical protein LX90_009325, partial [Lentzea flava]|nr:hypothetical protein [Lentzea flava]